MKGQIAEIVGGILVVIGIAMALIGVGTAISPISSVQNQTTSSLPHFLIGSLSAAFSGFILIIFGVILIFIGAAIIRAGGG